MQSDAPEPIRRALASRLGKKARKLAALLSELASDDDPKSVHDARVSSRRLQQQLGALFPKPRPGKARKLDRELKRIRRALGQWRNSDVLLALAARERRRTRRRSLDSAWEVLSEYIRARRGHAIARARKKLAQSRLEDRAAAVLTLLERPARRLGGETPLEPPRAIFEEARGEWTAALRQAAASREAKAIHAFRIATKRLRYDAEIARELGDRASRPLLAALTEWQSRLGRWHDRQILEQWIAEALARPDFLLRDPAAARALLVLLEKGRARQSAELERIFRSAPDESRETPPDPKPGG